MQLQECWRYPVKSMMGESLAAAPLVTLGLVGDRAWATRDEVRGGIRGAKQIGALMQLRARYLEEPPVVGVIPAEITLPDGAVVMTNAPDVNERLSAALDHPVTLWPLQPADDLEHYKRGAPDGDFLSGLRDMFVLEENDPFPNLAGLPPELMEYESPPGTYYDAFPILLVSTSALDALQTAAPGAVVDVRRFRPNLVVDTGAERGFVEDAWVGRRLRVGETVLEVAMNCPRCVMTTRPFADLPEDRSVLKTLMREHAQDFGVYANVIEPGVVRPGDTVELLD